MMTYCLCFLRYNRYSQLHYQPLGADALVDEEPRSKQSKVYWLWLPDSIYNNTVTGVVVKCYQANLD